jgi:hypothetical protein
MFDGKDLGVKKTASVRLAVEDTEECCIEVTRD